MTDVEDKLDRNYRFILLASSSVLVVQALSMVSPPKVVSGYAVLLAFIYIVAYLVDVFVAPIKSTWSRYAGAET